MRTVYSRVRATLGLAVVAAALGACTENAAEIAAPVSTTLSANTTGGFVRLVKLGPAGTTATFSISATGGQLPLGSTVTIDACDESVPCPSYHVWLPTDETQQQVTITETSFTGDVMLERINVISQIEGTFNIWGPADPTVTVLADGTHTVAVRFKNVPVPPDDEGNAGCTPGFWKQDQHFQFWTAPYTPGTAFGSVFADAFPGQTLLDVVSNGGGGLDALGRHTVAALLNAASPDVDYGMTAGDVISAFNAAFASGDYEEQKNIFEGYNERGCTAKD
jgi:hypothetical protein